MNEQYLPIGRAATYLGVSVDTLRRWEKNKKISSSRLDGKNRYFLISDLDRLKYGDLLTVKEAAERLSVSPSTLRRLADEGQIGSIRKENDYRLFAVEEINRFLDTQEHALDKAKANDIVHDGPMHRTNEKITEPNDLHPSLRAYLVGISQTLARTQKTRKVFLTAISIAAIFFILIHLALAAAFMSRPYETAKFFGFEVKETKEASSSPSVLGVSTSIQKTDEGKAHSLASSVLRIPAATTLKILKTIYPGPVKDIDIDETPIVAGTGPQGEQGPAGTTGPTGPKGQAGTAGLQGPAGEKGRKGRAGETGDTGAQGENGPAGAAGPQGPAGVKGDTGAPGQGAAADHYVGRTSASYNGNISSGSLVGYKAANHICDSEFGGSHVCTTDEILATISDLPDSIAGLDVNVWVSGGPPGYTASANDCNAWTSASDSSLGRFWDWSYNDGGGRGWLTPCTSSLPLACCAAD